jgi:hypothetical protein
MIQCFLCNEVVSAERPYQLVPVEAGLYAVRCLACTNSQAGEETEPRVAASTAQKEQGNG